MISFLADAGRTYQLLGSNDTQNWAQIDTLMTTSIGEVHFTVPAGETTPTFFQVVVP